MLFCLSLFTPPSHINPVCFQHGSHLGFKVAQKLNIPILEYVRFMLAIVFVRFTLFTSNISKKQFLKLIIATIILWKYNLLQYKYIYVYVHVYLLWDI
jgi:hypothetical protein